MSILVSTETDAEPPWLDALLAEHGSWLRRLVRRRMADPALVDDAVQETLVRVCRSAPPADAAEVRPWLAVVARRACADVWRAQPPGAAALDDQWPALRAVVPGSDEHVAGLARRVRIDDTLRRLPPRHRRLLHKQAVLGLSYEEIADEEEVSVACVTSAIGRARAGFRRRYAEGDNTAAPIWLLPLHRVADRVRARLNAVYGNAMELAAASVGLGMAGMLVIVPTPAGSVPGTDVTGAAVPAIPAAAAAAPPLSAPGRADPRSAGAPSTPAAPPSGRASASAVPPLAPPPADRPRVGDITAPPPRVELTPRQWTVKHSFELEGPGGTAYMRSETTLYCEGGVVAGAVCPLASSAPGTTSTR